MKKSVNGVLVDMTDEEFSAMQLAGRAAEISERTRPLTESEVSRLLIARQINNIGMDDATASRCVEFHPALQQDGTLISAGTRIRWNGVLKRAAVDLWDTAENTPEAAPALWEDLAYREGVRVIPETVTAGTAFAENEPGWWDGGIYLSKMDNNVWTPEQYPAAWEKL